MWGSLDVVVKSSSSSILFTPMLKFGLVVKVEMSRSAFSSSQDNFFTRREIEFRGHSIREPTRSLLPKMFSFNVCCNLDWFSSIDPRWMFNLELMTSSADPRGTLDREFGSSEIDPRWKDLRVTSSMDPGWNVADPKCGCGVWLTSGKPTFKVQWK